MALFYDPITDEAGPSRTWEEDEEEFEELYGSKGYASYVLKLLPPADRLQKSGKLEADLLLVGASAIGRALLSQLGQTGEMIGIIWQDSQEKTARTPGRSQESEDTSGQIYALRATGGTVLVVVAQDGVQPERAVAWTRALFGGISAARTVVLGSLPSSKFLGASGDGSASGVYAVETSVQRASRRQAGSRVKHLPTGNLVDGLAAAVVSHCQVRNKAATLLVNVDQTTGPDQKAMQAVATSIEDMSELEAIGCDVNLPEIVSRSLKDLLSKSRKQSWSELYS